MRKSQAAIEYLFIIVLIFAISIPEDYIIGKVIVE